MQDLEQQQSQTEFNQKIIPFFTLLVSMVAIATTALFIKISVHEMSIGSTMFNRLWIASIIFLILNSFQKARFHNSEQANKPTTDSVQNQSYGTIDIVLLITMSIIYITGRFLWTVSLSQTNIANAMILSSLMPLFAALGGWLFLRQSFGIKFLIGLIVALLGSITLGWSDFNKIDFDLIGDAAALLSSVFFAASLLIVEKIRDKFSSASILLGRCLIGILLVFPAVLFEDHIFPTTRLGWVAVIGMAAIGETIGHGLLVHGVKFFSSSVVAIFTLLEPIIAIILAWLFFAEQMDGLTWVALALVLTGVYLAKDDVDQSAQQLPSAIE